MKYLSVPKAAIEGDDVEIDCRYTLDDGEKIAMVTYFWNNRQFIRLEPEGEPKVRFYLLPNLSVEVSVNGSLLFSIQF